MILWKRSEEEWDAIVEALEDKLEEEHDKRLIAEERAEELEAALKRFQNPPPAGPRKA